MPIATLRLATNRPLRLEIERRTGLPLRPSTARQLLDELMDGGMSASPATPQVRADLASLDPGWVLERAKLEGDGLADLGWWQRPSARSHDVLQRLWRQSVAVSLAARRLAREAGDADPDRVGRAGLLHNLGLWLVAAIDPDWSAAWFELPDLESQRDFELRELGGEVDEFAFRLAERSGCDPLIRDAIWLHADLGGDLDALAGQPERLALIQRAYDLADRAPWGFHPSTTGESKGGGGDSRLKILVAEVQARTGVDFVEADATPREEALTRSNARLRFELNAITGEVASRDRLLTAIARSSPADSLDHWAVEASVALGGEAEVVWEAEAEAEAESSRTAGVALGKPGYPLARVQIGTADPLPLFGADGALIQGAWNSWTALFGSYKDRESRLQTLLRSYRKQVDGEERRLRDAKLEALAEFAAGAGHELNNPLAVIVGRAQLLLARETDPKLAKSLRAILTQAQRAHRILRDLMYVARPPEPRPRFCKPDEILRASLRDAKGDADDREVRLSAAGLEHESRVWADPDGLRHLADTLLRNALEASPKGSQVRFSSQGDGKSLRWTVQDFGRGVSAVEGPHLFDPFYCGRQAGRGLGMGLPRAARFVAAVGGDIRWLSNPGQGTSFQVRLPLEAGPQPPVVDVT